MLTGRSADDVAGGLREGADALAIAGALLDLLGDSPGTVLVFEDLHWADEATIDVVRLLARRIESRAAFVVAMLRDDELTSQHPFRLGDLATAPAVRRLELGPLSLEAVGKLAAGTAPDPAGVWRKTGGARSS